MGIHAKSTTGFLAVVFLLAACNQQPAPEAVPPPVEVNVVAITPQDAANIVTASGQPEVFLQVTEGLFDGTGGVGRADTKKFLQGWMDRYVIWIERHAVPLAAA
jgi:hypothetical protein